MNQPKRMNRRKFIYAGLGAVIIIVGGIAAYFATRPPEVIEKTIVTTVSGTPTTVVKTVERVVEKTVPATPVEKRTLYYTDTINIQSIGAKLLVELITEKFNAKHPEVKVKTELESYMVYLTPKLLTQFKAGEGPHGFTGSDNASPGQFAVLNGIIPIDEYLDKYPEMKKNNWMLDGMAKSWKAYSEKLGATYLGYPIWAQPCGLFALRADHMAEVDLSPTDVEKARSFEDLVEIGKKLTRDVDGDGKIDRWGMELVGSKGDIIDNWLVHWPVALKYPDGLMLSEDWSKVQVNNDTWLEAYQWYYDFIHKYKIASPASITQSDEALIEVVIEGGYSAGVVEIPAVGTVNDRNPKLLKKGIIKFRPPMKINTQYRGSTYAYVFFLLKRPGATKKDYDAFFEYVREFFTEENQLEFARVTGFIPAHIGATQKLLKEAQEKLDKEDYSLEWYPHIYKWVIEEKGAFHFPATPVQASMQYDVLATELQAGLAKKKPLKSALDDAARKMRDMLAPYGFGQG
jgi:ABC-type glycerol-3-phosphate transport system substrate-binding protein